MVFTNRRKFRDMMPYVIGDPDDHVQAFFLMLITFVVSPFQVLVAGQADRRRRRRPAV